jgi:rifampicin phosphotransferase
MEPPRSPRGHKPAGRARSCRHDAKLWRSRLCDRNGCESSAATHLATVEEAEHWRFKPEDDIPEAGFDGLRHGRILGRRQIPLSGVYWAPTMTSQYGRSCTTHVVVSADLATPRKVVKGESHSHIDIGDIPPCEQRPRCRDMGLREPGMLPYVVRLTDSAASDPAVAGYKAATLARLLRQGFPVPDGFVLTTEGFREIVARLGLPGPGDAAAARSIPEDIRIQVAREVAAFGEISFAVRSSGTAEDLPGASFAGQYESVVGVRGVESVLAGLSTCIISAFAPRVSVYRSSREQLHLPDRQQSSLAVLIQRLIQPDAAGVAFSANPVTGEHGEVLVSAVRGLGERLVSGEATPDEWVIKGDSVESRARPENAIDGDQARRIADLAVRVQYTLGGPQDIEWAIAGGELFLLQARPITALPTPPDLRPPVQGFWTKETSHFPMPLTPFGASVYLSCLVDGTKAMCDAFGLLIDGMDHVSLGGEVYTRVVPLGGKDRPAPPWWLLAVLARLLPSMRSRARIAHKALQEGLADRFVEKWQSEWRDGLRKEIDDLRHRDLSHLADAELIEHLDHGLDLLRRGERIHFLLVPPYIMAEYELAQSCQELLGWSTADSLALLAGTSEASSEPGRKLFELSQLVAASDVGRQIVEESSSDTLARLAEQAPSVSAAFADYIERYGHRTLSYDPGETTLAERPDLLVSLVRDRVHDHRSPTSGAGDARGEAIARARKLLADREAGDRTRFENALAAAERIYPIREENIFYTDLMPNAVVRYAVVEAGRRLAQRGRLRRSEDAAYLTNEELRAALGGEADLSALVARRRSERAWVAAHPGPATYGVDPGPPPDGRGLPYALRYTTEIFVWTMDVMFGPPPVTGGDLIRGAPGSAGQYTGVVRIIHDESGFDTLRPGEVLVCPTTAPSWSVLFAQAGALVTDGGGILAHAAVIAREYRIPAVLATGDATTRLRNGQTVTVDGSAGTVSLPG